MLYVFLSHDVDWRKKGPSKEHILARKDRFENNVIKDLDRSNPYYNIPKIMEIEERLGIKSTFFFRTKYEGGDLAEYEDDIASLVGGGWEVGLHCDPESVSDIEKIRQEKLSLERLTKGKVLGNRVHYLKFRNDLPRLLQTLGFSYDSSVRNTKDQITKSEMGYSKIGKMVEFPVTLMDAYLFTYMKLSESQIIPTFQKTIDLAATLDYKVKAITVLWHDNVLQMMGGRMYEKIAEYLAGKEDVKVCRGVDLIPIINKLDD